MFGFLRKLFGYGKSVAVELVGEKDSKGQTRLHRAMGANEQFESEIKSKPILDLIAQGEDPNAKDDKQRTPLHIVLLNKKNYSPQGYFEVISELITKGADPNAKDYRGVTPFHILVNLDVECSWYDEDEDFINVIHKFINNGADVTAEDKLGQTPLYCAAYAGNVDAVNILLGKHVVRNHQKVGEHLTANDNRALYEAARLGDLSSVNRYLTFPEVVAKVTINNNDILRIAQANKQTAVVMRLMEFEAVRHYVEPYSDIAEPQIKPITPIANRKAVVEDVPARNLRSRTFKAK